MILIPFIFIFIVMYLITSVITFCILIPIKMGRTVNDFFSNNIGKVNFVITLIECYMIYRYIFN